MERDGEPVGFIAHSLQEVQTLAGARKDHRELPTGDPDLFETLGQADQGYVVDPQLRQHALSGVDLRKATVDATTLVPCTWLTSKHSIRSGALARSSPSWSSCRARLRAVRSPARATLWRTSDCSALRRTVSIKARLSPRRGTRRSTWAPRSLLSHTPMCTGSGGRTGTSTSRGTPSGDSPP